MFLAFNKPYRELKFTTTFHEIRCGISCLFKKEQMKVLQNYETLVNILSMAFGTKKKEPDHVFNPESADQLQQALGSALNGRK